MAHKSSIRDVTPRTPTLARQHYDQFAGLWLFIAGQLSCMSPAQFAVEVKEWEKMAASHSKDDPFIALLSGIYADEKRRKGIA